jgi:uncharacterized membrane protein
MKQRISKLLPAAIVGAALLIAPLVAVAAERGGHAAGSGHAYSGGRSFAGGGDRGYRGGDHDRGGYYRGYRGGGFGFGVGVPAYGYGYAAPAPCGYYDAWGRWIPAACSIDPYASAQYGPGPYGY